jgi:hypothetical protein
LSRFILPACFAEASTNRGTSRYANLTTTRVHDTTVLWISCPCGCTLQSTIFHPPWCSLAACLTTTAVTVVGREMGSETDGDGGAGGSDEPVVAWLAATGTRQGATRASEAVKAKQFQAAVVLREQSVQRERARAPFFPVASKTNRSEPGMCHHG